MMNASAPVCSTDHARLASEATTVLFDGLRSEKYNMTSGYGQLRTEDMTQSIQTYSETTLRKIISLRDNDDIALHCFTLESIIFSNEEHVEEFISDYLHLKHCFPSTNDGRRDAAVTLLLASLDEYEGLAPIGPNFEYPQERIDQCTAIFTLVEHFEKLYDDGIIDEYPVEVKNFDSDSKYGHVAYVVEQTSDGYIRYLEAQALVDLITHPDTNLDFLKTLVTERDIHRADEIRNLLYVHAGNAPILINGVL